MGIPRIVLTVLLTAALAGWVLVVHRLSKEPLVEGPAAWTAPAAASPAAEPAPGDAAALLAFASNAECEPCHKEIYEEWRADQHAAAWFNEPLLPPDPRRTECNNCHAPQAILEVGVETLPLIRAARFEEGVGCIECHRHGDRAEGPLASRPASCKPTHNAIFVDSVICSSCHAPHGSYGEWKESAWARKGYSCQACHMKLVDAPTVTGEPPRRRRSHRMRSQRDPAMLREALQCDIRVADGKLDVALTNSGAAHNVPGEISNREVFLSVKIFDGDGNRVAAHRESFKTVKREQRASVPSTQFRPGETRRYRYDLVAAHGTVKVLVGYKLFLFTPDTWALPVWEKQLDF